MTEILDLAQKSTHRTWAHRLSLAATLRRLWPRAPRRPEPLPPSLLHDLGLHAEHRAVPLSLHHTDPLLRR